MTQHFAAGESAPGLAPKIYVSFLFFIAHLSSSDNIFETETWYFGGNMKVLLGYLYTCWSSEGMDVTRWLTGWMIGHDIFVSSCMFSQLKYDRILGKNLGHDTYGVKSSPWLSTLQGSDPGLAPKTYISFQFEWSI